MIGLLALLAAVQLPAETGSIRIGLADAEPVARIGAPTPFTIRAGELEIEATDILVGPETRPGGAPVVTLGAWPTREGARDALRRFRGEPLRASPTRPPAPLAAAEQRSAPARIARDPESGRYLVVLGEPADVDILRASGFLQAGLVPFPVPEGEALRLRPVGGLPIRIPPGVRLEIRPGGSFLEWEGQPYRGVFEVFRAAEGVTVVNRLPVEDYLKGVAPRELPPDLFPEPEALKAQALVARTYALRPRPAWRDRGYDLCSGPGCQVYGGVAAEHPMATAAIQATAGEVLTHRGELADALYTAACGGRTENAENVFSAPAPYLVSREGVREGGGFDLTAGAATPLVPLDAALVGGLPSDWPGALGEPAAPAEAATVIGAALTWLGLPVCSEGGIGEPAGMHLDQYAEWVAAFRCRPTERMHVRTSPLDRLLEEGLLDASELGIVPGRAVTRREVISTAAALMRRSGPLLTRGQVRDFGSEGLLLEPDRPAPLERMRPAPGVRLYREVRPLRIPGRPASVPPPVPEQRLRVRLGDFVRYRSAPGAPTEFDVLVLEDLGETWDRFSAQSAWLVPKHNADLSRSLAERYPDRDIGRVTALEPLEFGASGRIRRLRIRGARGALEVRGLEVRRALGLADTLFAIEPRLGADGQVEAWWFTGRGWGHGLGLCQAGAYGMAAHGFDYREILAHYYPETRIETVGGTAR